MDPSFHRAASVTTIEYVNSQEPARPDRGNLDPRLGEATEEAPYVPFGVPHSRAYRMVEVALSGRSIYIQTRLATSSP
jgi:hypothetical protein